MHAFTASLVLLLASVASAGGVFYETGFEAAQGYTPGALDGQDGWTATGSGAALVIDGVGPLPLNGFGALLEPPTEPGLVRATRALPSGFGSLSIDIRFDTASRGARGGNSDAELEILGPAQEFVHAVRFANGSIELFAGGGINIVGAYAPGDVVSLRFENPGDGQQHVYLNGQQVYTGPSLALSSGENEAPTAEFRLLVDGALTATLDNLLFEEVSLPCPADLTNDGAVGSPDIAALLAAWGDCPPASTDTVIGFEPAEGFVAGPLDGQGGWSAGCTLLADVGAAPFGSLTAILNPDDTPTSCVASLDPAPFYGAVSATVSYDASAARGGTAPASLTLVDTVSNFQILTIILSRDSGIISVRTRDGFEDIATRSGSTTLDIRAELLGDGMQRISLDGVLAYEGLSARADDPPIDRVSFSSGTNTLLVDNITLTDISGAGCTGDFNSDSAVDSADLATLLAAWGPCP